MKRFLLPLALVMTLLATTAGTALAEVTTTTERITVPLASVVPNHCTGERITLTGELLLIVHTTVDDSGGVHTIAIIVPQDVRGEDETGTQYKVVGGAREITNITGNGAETFTQTEDLVLVSPGGTGNVLITSTFHFTMNANGEPTAEVVRITAMCTGTGSAPAP